MYIVIRAGGVGTRLWPISRQSKPKQLHALVGCKTMLQEAIKRVEGVVTSEQIFVSCNQLSAQHILRNIRLKEGHLIIEPASRETTAAIGLESIKLATQDPHAIVASLGSDYSIKDTVEFQRILKLAEQTVQHHPNYIVCIGVTPERPDTGYGYIELGEVIQSEVFNVKSFKEKPDSVMAEQFYKSGHYLWNANMFVWRVDTILKLYKEYMPVMYEQLMAIQRDWSRLDEIYTKLEKVAVDYAIIERANTILAIPGRFGWNDIGDWARLKDELVPAEVDNYSHGDHLSINTKNSLVFSETNRVIATLGVSNLIIVDTPDALLICDKSRSQDVKHIVDHLKKNNRQEVL